MVPLAKPLLRFPLRSPARARGHVGRHSGAANAPALETCLRLTRGPTDSAHQGLPKSTTASAHYHPSIQTRLRHCNRHGLDTARCAQRLMRGATPTPWSAAAAGRPQPQQRRARCVVQASRPQTLTCHATARDSGQWFLKRRSARVSAHAFVGGQLTHGAAHTTGALRVNLRPARPEAAARGHRDNRVSRNMPTCYSFGNVFQRMRVQL